MNRSGIFAGDDPFEIARQWLEEAGKTEPSDPNAVALATTDSDGMPNARVVLLKAIEDDAFVFYTNYQSTKGVEIAHSGNAAFVMHWKSLARQIRVRGVVTKEESEASDAYYHSRPLGSRIGAWASDQSQPLESREVLEAAVAEAEAKHGKFPQRPPHWGGYRIDPLEIEFWAAGEFRLHNRFRWTRKKNETFWNIQRLNP